MSHSLVDLAVGVEFVALVDGQTVADELAHGLDVALRLAGQQLYVIGLLEADHLHADAVPLLAVPCEALDILHKNRFM